MQVSRTTGWTDDTEVLVSSVATRLHRIEAFPGVGGSNAAFVQIWNNANPNPGTTVADVVIRIPPSGTVAGAMDLTPVTVDFGSSGLLFNTALSYLVTTTGANETVPTGVNAPTKVELHFTPLA